MVGGDTDHIETSSRSAHPLAALDMFPRKRWILPVAVLFGLLVAACAAASPSSQKADPVTSRSTVPTPSAASPQPVTTTTAPDQPAWTPLSTVKTGVAIDRRTVVTSDGARVTLIRFHAGQVRFDLHAGSREPPTGGVALGADGGGVVSASERSVLLAAFNGGFKARDSTWGVEIDGHVLTALVPGMASLVIDDNGAAHIGIWGETVPVLDEAVASVRQNLPPLVVGSRPSPQVAVTGVWGSPLHGVAFQARSALGEDSSGDLIYAASMGALPVDLASAQVLAGATIAMELDINPEWVQADVAPTPGVALEAVIPGQTQPSDRYLLGWTRDFVTVDALVAK
jgi:hypothetical protein